MRLFSWNVNGIRSAARKGYLEWLAGSGADVVCLQEIKAKPAQLKADLLEEHGYHVVWVPAERPGYAGTATFSRETPDEVILGFGEERFDVEGRTVTTRYGSLVVINGYFPQGKSDLSRVPYKSDYYRLMMSFAQGFRDRSYRVVICGDWNTAHKEIDLKNWRPNRKKTGFLPEECALIDEFIEAGWHDAFRELHPEEAERYSWWSQRGGSRGRNVGWRLDYHFVSDELWPEVISAEIHDQVMGSDHCPVELYIA